MSSAIRIALAVAAGVFITLAGCSSRHVPVSPPMETPAIHSLLVLPVVNMAALYGQGKMIQSPLSGLSFLTGPVAEDGPQIISSRLYTELQATAYDLFPFDPLLEIRPGSSEQGAGQAVAGDSFLARVLKLARQKGTDGVVLGFIYRYRERVGTGLSVESPASVAFGLNLVRASDGKLVWSASFDQTQQPLSENLLNISQFLKGHGKWMTVRQLALYGLDQALRNFPRP